ncbi:MAG: Rrf2 family transcriptional regulator [Actinobacteria bacterium]|nr:Rrf2 family transcriptional regulator [Actinomycetota bacterium]
MNLITRNTDYAIRALCYMVKSNKDVVSVRELVEGLKMPGPFLRKVLQELNKKGILKSYKGKNGGFVLADRPEKIYMGKLIEIFQGPIKLQEHTFKKEICPEIKSCVLKKKIDEMEKYTISRLNSLSIASLLKTGK